MRHIYKLFGIFALLAASAVNAQLVDTGLVVRYYIDEAASGTTPTTVVDASSNSYDLTTVNYGSGNMAYTEVSGNRGLEATATTGTQRASRAIDNTSDALRDALAGAQQITLEIVFTPDAVAAGGGRVFGINGRAGENGELMLKAGALTDGNILLSFNDVNYPLNGLALTAGARVVLHVVIDSTQATAADRLEWSVNGSALADSGTSIPLNETLALGSDQDIIAFNRENTGSFDRSMDGVVSYAAVYAYGFTNTDVTTNYDILTLDDDTPAGGSPATLSSATPSGTLGTATTATLGATTDQTTGTFYGVVDTAGNISGITAAQVKAGDNNGDTAAVAASNSAVSTTTPSTGVTGLTADTAYSYAVVQNNANGDSNVLTGTFTTAVAGSSLTAKFRHYQQMKQ
jgi:hypothetical protein